MKITSIQGRLGLLLLAFVVLVTVSIGATFWGLDTQKNDALVINLAGRQRMLVQQLARLVIEFEKGEDPNRAVNLDEPARMFEQTLAALRDGGTAPYLPDQTVEIPPPRSHEIETQLDQVHQTWEVFRKGLDQVANGTQGSPEIAAAFQIVEETSSALVDQADTAVRLFEIKATQKVIRLRGMQIGFFISALLLSAVGGWLIKKSVLEPLRALGREAERIGEGDLSTPMTTSGPDEIAVLANTFESMQAQLKTSRAELVAWNEKLEKRVAQRTRELDALYEVSRDISSHLEVQHVLGSVTEKARGLLDGEVAALCLLDSNGRTLTLKAHNGPAEAISGEQTNCQTGLANQVLSGKQTLTYEDGKCVGMCGILTPPYHVSHLAAPLCAGDQDIGAMCVGSSTSNAFSEDAPFLLTKLANSAAIALENARLYAQAERVAALEERQRIAADMHDGVIQTMSYLGLSIDQICDRLESGQNDEALERLEWTRDIIDQLNDSMRSAIANLVDNTPPRQNLQDRLEALIGEFERQNGSVVKWKTSLEMPLVLSRDAAEQVLRVANEALLNAYRHGQASHINIGLQEVGSDYILAVEDNGRGFDPTSPPADGRRHFGIRIMQARAARLAGQLSIQSDPGCGTKIILQWPATVPD